MEIQTIVYSALVIFLHFLHTSNCLIQGADLNVNPKLITWANLVDQGSTHTANNTILIRAHLIHRDDAYPAVPNSLESRTTARVKRSKLRSHELKKLNHRFANDWARTSSPVTALRGEYAMKLAIGSPPQQFTVLIDTASDLLWVQCTPCSHCFDQPDPFFNSAASSTFLKIPCNGTLCAEMDMQDECQSTGSNSCLYQYGYDDGSGTGGDLIYEAITLPTKNSTDLSLRAVLGCAHSAAMPNFGEVDGLVGLGRGVLSLPSQFSNQSIAPVFSYCLVDMLSRTASSPITFGDAGENALIPAFTPMLQNGSDSFYYVGVEGISVGGLRVPVPASAFQIDSSGGGGVFIDSGTADTMWATAAFTPILAAFRRLTTYPEVNSTVYDLNLCYDVSAVTESTVFPGMMVHMTNLDFEIPEENLFGYMDDADRIVCLFMIPNDDTQSIIGCTQQQNNLIVFDNLNDQIGITPVTCGGLE